MGDRRHYKGWRGVVDALLKKAQDFPKNNPDLEKALELFRIANEQYESALRALRRPEIRVSNSTNESLPTDDST